MNTTGGSPAEPLKRVGIVGWGRMGGPIGAHLIRSGFDVTAHDPSEAACDDARAVGAEVADSPRAVGAASDLVLVVVADDQQTREAVLGADGILSGAGDGCVVAICASVAPETCQELGAAAAERGVRVIDAAMTGGERGVARGTLTLLCGGDASVVRACSPVFSAFATNVCYVGDLGSGQIAKALNNCLLLTCIQANLEVLRVAKGLGIQPSALRPVLGISSGANKPLTEWGSFQLRFPEKDLKNAFALADKAGVDMGLMRSLRGLITSVTRQDLDEVR